MLNVKKFFKDLIEANCEYYGDIYSRIYKRP